MPQTMNVKKRAHAVVRGSVQGIGYRYFALKHARDLGLTGWVKNLPTGEVELEIEGEDQAIGNYIKVLQTKHPWARVSDVEMNWLEYSGEFQNFEITA